MNIYNYRTNPIGWSPLLSKKNAKDPTRNRIFKFCTYLISVIVNNDQRLTYL
jgi:hypothetical protein